MVWFFFWRYFLVIIQQKNPKISLVRKNYLIQPKMNLEDANLFVLKKHNISARDFKDSYNYYVNDSKSLNEIYDNAKKIILEKDPKMKEYLKKNKFEDNPKQ